MTDLENLSQEVIQQVLCDSGEVALQVKKGQTFEEVLTAAGHALDGAYLTNVVVVQTKNGFYVGDFSFSFRKVEEEEARKTAEDFGD